MRITVVMAGLLLALAAAPSLAQQPATKGDKPPATPRSTAAAAPPRGDGPANALNSFVMKEIAQCRTLPAYERRACCEKVLHPNACVE